MPTYSVVALLQRTPPDVARGRMNAYSLTERDMRVLLALFQEHRPARVLELGLQEGYTARFLLDTCPFIQRYVGVDLIPSLFPSYEIVPKVAGRQARADRRLHVLLTNGKVAHLEQELRRWTAAQGQPAFDAVLMDADHEEHATRRDSEACDAYLRPGGLMLWHDYGVASRQGSDGRPFSMKRYIDRLVASGRRIMLPDERDRDPWRCCSLAWEVKAVKEVRP